MKPIEPGCLALVIQGEDSGMVVTCIKYCAPGFRYRCFETMRLMETVGPSWVTEEPDGMKAVRDQSALLRIDGGDAESEERIAESQDMEASA